MQASDTLLPGQMATETPLFNHRIVIPQAVQKETLKKIHEGHQGIERCRMRVRASVWWPGISKRMEQMVLQCQVCAKAAQVHKEPLIASQLPAYPWQVVGSDFCLSLRENITF